MWKIKSHQVVRNRGGPEQHLERVRMRGRAEEAAHQAAGGQHRQPQVPARPHIGREATAGGAKEQNFGSRAGERALEGPPGGHAHQGDPEAAEEGLHQGQDDDGETGQLQEKGPGDGEQYQVCFIISFYNESSL